MQKEETGAAQNNEEYLKHFGFTVDDLSFLISPQSSLSPIKKKQRNVFNFENVGDELDASAPAPAVPGPYPANYPTVYQDTYDQSAPYIKEEVHENEHEHDHGPIPSFEGLDLTSFENENSDEYVKAPPSYGSNNAQCGSEASSIATEPIDIGFSRMGSSMGMGSLNFSTMTSFNFDEADADAMLAQDALNALSSMSAQNGHGRVPEGVADMAGLWPAGSVGSMLSMSLNPSHNSRVNNTMMSLPPLPQMPASHMHVEDASYILNGQGNPHNNSSGNNSNRASWNHQEFQQRSSRANPDGNTATPPLSRISSFKSTLSPLSVDMNALNAAHQAHQEARLYQQSFGGNSANHSRNSSFYSTQQSLNHSMNHGGNVSSSDRSSGASSPERNSFGSGQAVGKRAKRTTEKERERRGSRSSRDDPAGAAAMLLSLSSGFNKETKSNADKKAEKAAERAAEKAAEKEREKQKEKEQKEKEDTRASKSLATISRRFVEHFGDTNTFEYISGMLHVDDVHDGPPVTNRVDGAAEVLGVHVRRIYELIKILEILSLVTFTGDKRGKFGWRGTKDFLITLGTIQAEGITKYPEIAYSHGIRLPEQPLQSPSAACGSPLTMSLPSTPVYMEGMTSPFFGASGSSSKARGRHPGFESAVQDSERDRSAALALGPGSSGIGYENDSVNPYDKHLTASVGTASEPSAGYASHLATSLDIDLSSTLMDPDPQSSSSPIAQLESTELTDLDAFAAHMLSTDVPMELSQPELMPKYSKKRAAVKKSSKSATPAGDKAAGDSHEEFMVEGICKSFLQLFLVGMDGLSMNFAIQKLVPMEPNQTLHEYNKLNATKIRRVYDVANVLCSLNLINKNTITAAKKGAKSEMNTPDSHSHSHASYQSRESPHKDAMNSHNNSWTTNTNTNNMNNMNNMNSMNMYGNNGHPANGTPMSHTLVGHNNNNESSNSFQDASSTTGKARGEGGKGDKLLEWGSFPPTVIRDYYLNKMCI